MAKDAKAPAQNDGRLPDAHYAGLTDWAQRNAAATVLLDSSGSLVLANEGAVEIAAREDALRIDAAGLHAFATRDEKSLQGMIRDAAAANRTGQNARFSATMRLPRRTGRRDYLVQVTRLHCAREPRDTQHFIVCVLIWDPEGTSHLAPNVLNELFAMTPAETRLVQQLLLGKTPAQAARELDIAVTTVRYHLARLYRKTQTQGLSDLLGLLHRIAGGALCP